MDKIYSRPRLKIKRFKNRNKKEKIKFIIYIIIVIIFLWNIILMRAAYPIFMSNCENAAVGTATNILNREVNEVMIVYNYDDLVNIGKNQNRTNNLYRS